MDQIKVSVIIPTHNRKQMLARAVDSVLRQSHPHWELFIVDDGSNDGTEAWARTLSDPRICYLRHSTNQGACAARNTGIRAASGDFIAWLDSDDEWWPDKLERQLQRFAQTSDPALGVVTCGVIFAREDGKTTLWLPTHRGHVVERLFNQEKLGVGPQYLLVKRKYLFDPEPLLFDVNMPARQDLDFTVRLLQRCHLDFVEAPLVTIHHHKGERVWTPERSIQADYYFHEKYRRELEARPLAHSRHHLRTAATCIGIGQWAEARAQSKEAIRAYYIDPSAYLWWLFAHTGQSRRPSMVHLAALKVLRRLTFGSASL
jgi:glycosyltransferase involved in cell wall biosynthesis